MLPDCECKGRAFLHSLQDFAEKKCEKNSFAPILPLHSMAKSAVKPIFSPLPHPIFFAPKSPFFPLFPVLSPTSDDFSMARSRFLPCEVHFFLVFPRFGSDFGRFFDGSPTFFPHSTVYFLSPSPILNPISGDFSMARHSFQPQLQFFLASSYTSPYFGHFFERSHPLFSPHFSFRTARILFRFGFPFLSHLPHLPIFH